jgi:hypothetical protein
LFCFLLFIKLIRSGWLEDIFNEGANLPLESTSPGTPSSSLTSSLANSYLSLSSSQPLNLTMGLRLEAAQALLEALRTGLKEGEPRENDAIVLLQYALNVLGFIPEQSVDEGNFGYISPSSLSFLSFLFLPLLSLSPSTYISLFYSLSQVFSLPLPL